MKLPVNRLLKDELIFELLCRGAAPADTLNVKELQGMLRQLLKQEKQGKSFKSEHNCDPAEELEVIKQKLTVVKGYLKQVFLTTLIRNLKPN